MAAKANVWRDDCETTPEKKHGGKQYQSVVIYDF